MRSRWPTRSRRIRRRRSCAGSRALGIGADIASAGELAAVTRAGFDMRRVDLHGPGKTDAELAAAIRSGVRAITIESLEELDVLLDLAPLAGRHQGLVLRLTAEEMSRGAEGTPIIGAGGASKFGLLREELDSADRPAAAGGGHRRPGIAVCAARAARVRCLERAGRRPADRRASDGSRPRPRTWRGSMASGSGWSTLAAGWASRMPMTRHRSTSTGSAGAWPRSWAPGRVVPA